MFTWICLSLVASAATAVIEQGGVRVEPSVSGQAYSWVVTNVAAAPIMSFEVGQSNAYYGDVPPGWQIQFTAQRFRVWTDDPLDAIERGQSRRFTATVASSGAVLGLTSAWIGFGQGTPPLVLHQVWGPRPSPRGLVVLVVGLLALIGIAHTIATGRLARAPRAGSPSQTIG